MDKLQWGNRKRLRFVKVKESTVMNGKSDGNEIVVKKKITSQRVDRRVVNEQNSHIPPVHASSPQRINRVTNRKIMSALSSPEKEDRYYTTRGSTRGGFEESSSINKVLTMDSKQESKKTVWPKIFTTLSSKEKEEDFMAMKGCKLPQRPKKRAKMIQRTLLLVSPGAWLSDLCQERYEVREKKTSKKGALANWQERYELYHRIIAVIASDRSFLDQDYDTYSTSRSFFCFRSVACIFVVLLFLHHALPVITNKADSHSVG